MRGFASLIIFIVLSSSLAFAFSAAEAEQGLEESRKTMDELSYAGFNLSRYNDTLTLTEQLFYSGMEDGKQDFTMVETKLQDLENIANNAFQASDALKALKARINLSTAAHKSDINELYSKAKTAFTSQRYEESMIWIEATYEKINDMEAAETKMRAFYDASKRNIVSFFTHNWRYVLGYLFTLIFIMLVFYPPYSKWRIRKKIKKLKGHETVLKELIAETQKEFFEDKILNEENYYTRINKYGNMLRDIYQQIPFLREELELKRDLKKDLAKRLAIWFSNIKEKKIIKRIRKKKK
jgi:hypothetical protein